MKRRKVELIEVKCDQIQTGRNYRHFKKEELGDLLESIMRRGLIQPIVLTINHDDKTKKQRPYELVAGERRYSCCNILKRPVKAVLYPEVTEEDFVAFQVAENAKRHINPAELAESAFKLYKELIAEKMQLDATELDKYTPKNFPREYRKELTLTDFAVIVGRNESTLNDYFSFLDLDKRIKVAVINGKYDFGKAVMLSKLPQDKQLQVFASSKGSKKDLENILSSMLSQENSDNFSLTNEPGKKIPDYSLIRFMHSLNRVIKAGDEYFSHSSESFNGELEKVISPALETLYQLRSEFEERAQKDGKLNQMLSIASGKKEHKKFILEQKLKFQGKPAADVGGELHWIDISLLDEDKEQPRQTYDPRGIEELAKSMDEVGQITPVLVSPENERYIVVDGNRRRRALISSGEKMALCIVEPMTRIQRRIYQFEAEFHKEDQPDERAHAIYRWTKFKEKQAKKSGEKITRKEIATKLGIGRDTVRRALEFVSVTESVKRMYNHHLLTYEATAELSRAEKKDQREIAFKVYLRGGDLKRAREALSSYVRDKNQMKLIPDSEIKTGFGQVFLQDFRNYFQPAALLRLRNGDIYSPSFVHKFYSLINDVEKLNKHHKNYA